MKTKSVSRKSMKEATKALCAKFFRLSQEGMKKAFLEALVDNQGPQSFNFLRSSDLEPQYDMSGCVIHMCWSHDAFLDRDLDAGCLQANFENTFCDFLSSAKVNILQSVDMSGRLLYEATELASPTNRLLTTQSAGLFNLEFAHPEDCPRICFPPLQIGVQSARESHNHPYLQVKQALAGEGIFADIEREKSDEIFLFHFYKKRKAWIDVYTDGEIIVILSDGDKKLIYEYGIKELSDLVTLFKDGGF